MSESLKQKTFKGTIWSAIEQFSVQGIQFVVMIFMARLLMPSDYGIVGMITIFIAICNSFINSGFSNALIRKQDRTPVDESTVFYFNIVVGFFLYGVLFFCAPLIAKFYNEPVLTPITRAVGLSLIFGSLCVVQRAQYTLRIDFKTQARASLSAAALSGITGIIFAYYGFGVWALVIQQIVSMVVNSSLLWIFSPWRPIRAFSWTSLKTMFGFGSRLLASGLLDTIYGNMYSLVIGKVFSASSLGFYSRAKGFGQMASSNITMIIQRVTYPVLCKLQNDDESLRNGYSRMMRTTAFVVFPLMFGMAAIAKPLIATLVGEKWLFSAALLVPVCLNLMWYPIHAMNLNLLQVKGRSDLFLRLEIIKKILGVTVLIISIPFGLLAMCWIRIINNFICIYINTYYTGKLVNLGFFRQMKDIMPTLLLSLVMGVIVWLTISILHLPDSVIMTIGIIEGAAFYVGTAKLLRFPEFAEIISLIKRNPKKQTPSKELSESPTEGLLPD